MWGGFLDLVFPLRCVRCGRHSGCAGGEVCRECGKEMPAPAVTRCPGCGVPAVEGPLAFCRSCRGGFHRDGLLAPARYEGGHRDLIHAFKYRADFQAGRYLARRMADSIGEELPVGNEVIVPVPLHRRRLRSRGFNQACVLARRISRERGLALAPAALERKADTLSLTGLDRRERAREVKGAITVRDRSRVRRRSLLVVDDVVTTGATVEECCRVLKEAGAARVVAVAAARA